MLSSISPVGEASRRQRWSVTAIAHLLGATLGGATVGALLGAVGALVLLALDSPATSTLLLVLAVAAMAGLALDLSPAGEHVPSWRRQVDERWLTTYRGWVYGAGYGLQLGAGMATIIPASTTYVLGLAALLTGSPVSGAILGATFGAVRALPLLLTVRITTPAALTRLMQRMASASRPARLLTVAGQASVAVAALALVVA
jgi:hypothetical protein